MCCDSCFLDVHHLLFVLVLVLVLLLLLLLPQMVEVECFDGSVVTLPIETATISDVLDQLEEDFQKLPPGRSFLYDLLFEGKASYTKSEPIPTLPEVCKADPLFRFKLVTGEEAEKAPQIKAPRLGPPDSDDDDDDDNDNGGFDSMMLSTALGR